MARRHLPIGDERRKDRADPHIRKAQNIAVVAGILLLVFVMIAARVQNQREQAKITKPPPAAEQATKR